MRPYSRLLSYTIVIFGLLTAVGCTAAVLKATRPPVPTPTLATAIKQDKAIELAIGGCRIPHLVLVGDPGNIRAQLMSLDQADQLTRTISETTSYIQPMDTWVWLVKMDGLLQIVGGPPPAVTPTGPNGTAEPPPTSEPFWGTCTVIVDATTGAVISVRGQASAQPPKQTNPTMTSTPFSAETPGPLFTAIPSPYPVPASASSPTLSAPPTASPVYAPIVAPPMSEATSTIVTPPSVYATQQPEQQATIVARATASPFPTAGAPIVQAGRPASAITRRDGLSLWVTLPKDAYLAGEGGQADITLRNDGPETIFADGGGPNLFDLTLLDEQGHEPSPWPWATPLLPGQPRLQKLAPGETITDTVLFQVPPAEQAAGHAYVIWAETKFSRPSPAYAEGPDNIWLSLETGPIPIQITAPGPAQGLTAEVTVDQVGWRVRVVDTAGRVPAGPAWGKFEMASPNSYGYTSLQQSVTGLWSGTWENSGQSPPGLVRAWVAAPSYVTAAITQTMPGTGDINTLLGMPAADQGPIHLTFASLEAAQTVLDFPLYHPAHLPGGAQLNSVSVETGSGGEHRWANVSQVYYLPGNSWLELTQIATTEHYEGAGWGKARYDQEARPASVNSSAGYLTQRFGWWILDWKVGDVGFELRAPVSAFPQDDLVAMAAAVQLPR